MRITTGMITSQYMRNLNTTLSEFNYHTKRSTNFRRFNRASENPIAAARAFSLRRSYLRNDDYMQNALDATDFMKTADTALQSLVKITTEAGSEDCLQAVNGTQSEQEREAIAAKLRKMQETIITQANTQYGDRYVFGGTTTTSPPFTVGEDGALFYKDVNVTTGEHKGLDAVSSTANINSATIDFGVENGDIPNEYTINIKEPSVPPDATELNQIDPLKKEITVYLTKNDATPEKLQDALQAIPVGNPLPPGTIDPTKITVKAGIAGSVLQGTTETSGGVTAIPKGTKVNLDKLANENMFVDLGLGLEFKNQNLNKQSAFDMAMPGISFLGYGKDDNGNPKNMYVLLNEIATKLEKGDDEFNFDDTMKSISTFQNSQKNLITKETEIGAKENFIEYAQIRLKDAELTLNEKISNVEMVKPEEAITDFKMAEFTYMAALQMGSKIIQPSFLDYMT
ncbi:MAG: flagellar hook-associated protein FlgL [Oscillospiraceae bacterium]